MPSLYVHIPFCARKCFYCSFVVAVSAEKYADKYLDCVALEAERFRGEALETIYIGGGTPSHLSPQQITRLMEIINSHFDCSHVKEITMEANPEDIQEARLHAVRQCGINRISLGVQTFDEGHLKYLGRNHDAKSALKAAKIIDQFDFRSVNIDLMFGFEGQKLHEAERDAERIMELKPRHISLYGLTVEPKSRFFAQGKIVSSELQGEMYTLLLERLKQYGYGQYEVSNFALSGHESRHNINYWLGGDYIGLGVGAHSHRDRRRWWNVAKLMEYVDKMDRGLSVEEGFEQLSHKEHQVEKLLFGLRMNRGIDAALLRAGTFDDHLLDKLRLFMDEGFLIREEGRIKASDKGRLVLDELSSQLI